MDYLSIQELVELAESENKRISDLIINDQAKQLELPRETVFAQMEQNYQVMLDAIETGINSSQRSASGLSGGDAAKLHQAVEQGKTIGGGVLDRVLVKAIAVAEVNACMGKIVAAPTAGSCGILPAVLSTIMDEHKLPREEVVSALFTAAGVGMVIAKKASISGAEGGCQAECGSAAAMAAAALVELMGGTPRQVAHATAISIKSVLGLVCDPVAGLVEVPCVKRNAMGAANALMAAELALAGIESKIPVDEVISTMKSIGDMMVPALKETAQAGLATTPTGKKLAKTIFGK